MSIFDLTNLIFEIVVVELMLASLSLLVAMGTMIIFSRVLRDSTPRFVGPLVRPFVHPSVCHTLLFRR